MILAVDTETTGTDFFHGCAPFMVSACDGETVYLFEGSVNPWTREVFWDDDVLQEIKDLLDSAKKLIFHNACFDIRALDVIGIPVEWDKIEDTLVASHCICSGDTHNLKDLAVKYLHYWDDDEEDLAQAVNSARSRAQREGYCTAKEGHKHFPGLAGAVSWSKMDYWLAPEECRQYAGKDAERTWLLWRTFKQSLQADSLFEVYKTRRSLLRIVYDMTTYGINFNQEEAIEFIESSEEEMEALRKEIKVLAGIQYKFDPNKRDHLIDLIHTKLKIPVMFHTKGSDADKLTPSMDKNALNWYEENYDAPAITKLSEYRKKQTKVRYMDSYIKWLAPDGRIHPNWNITGTRETRQSCSAPNMQNVDKALAHYYGPPPGKIWIDLDMVNIELRIWTYMVGNKELLEIFEAGGSVHLSIAEVLHKDLYNKLGPDGFKKRIVSPQNEYTKTKNGNFALIYGATEKKANDTYGVPNAVSMIVKRFPEIGQFMLDTANEVWDNVHRVGVPAVHTWGGYRLDVPADEPFKAANYKVQGTAGYLMGLCMIALDRSMYYEESFARMMQQVHDSLKIEVPILPGLGVAVRGMIADMEKAGMELIPTCPLDYKVIVNPEDYRNPLVSEFLPDNEVPF